MPSSIYRNLAAPIQGASESIANSVVERDANKDSYADRWRAVKALMSAGGVFLGYAAKALDFTVDETNGLVTMDATAANRAATLPDATLCTGQILDYKRIDSSVFTCALDGNAAQTIDGDLLAYLNFKDESIRVYSDGANWRIASRYLPFNIVTKAANFTCDGVASLYAVTVGAGGVTAILPPAASWKGKRLTFKRMDAGAGAFILDGSGAELIDGAATITLSATTQRATEIYCDGTGWLSDGNRA